MNEMKLLNPEQSKVKWAAYETSAKLDGIVEPFIEMVENNQRPKKSDQQRLLQIKADHPRYPEVFYALGLWEMGRAHHRTAIQYFSKAAALNPTFLEAHLNNAI